MARLIPLGGPPLATLVLTVAAATAVAVWPSTASAQMGDPSQVTLKTSPVVPGISMIEGANGFAGGNVAASVGKDGLFIVDDELEPMTTKLKVALAALSPKPVRFVINTHWHGDHTGANPVLGAAGAVIVAHENVRKRLSVDKVIEFAGQKHTFAALPPEGLPVVTFSDDVTLHLNGDDVHVIHVPPAHTDGDALVHFTKANVLHMGDTFGSRSYPLVDVSSGGTFDGFITAADRALALCNDTTKIIPGHGPIVGITELKAWRDMLVKIRDRVAALAAEHKSLDEIVAAKPTAEFDARWTGPFVKPDALVALVYQSLPPAPAKPAAEPGKRHKK